MLISPTGHGSCSSEKGLMIPKLCNRKAAGEPCIQRVKLRTQLVQFLVILATFVCSVLSARLTFRLGNSHLGHHVPHTPEPK